jgi:hypothetical protein
MEHKGLRYLSMGNGIVLVGAEVVPTVQMKVMYFYVDAKLWWWTSSDEVSMGKCLIEI